MNDKRTSVIDVIKNAKDDDIEYIALLYEYKEKRNIIIEAKENFDILIESILSEFDNDCIGKNRSIKSIVAFDECVEFEELLLALYANEIVLNGDDTDE